MLHLIERRLASFEPACEDPDVRLIRVCVPAFVFAF